MKIVYIAHPIGGKVMANIEKLLHIIRQINLESTDVVPCAPYIGDVLAMNDADPAERSRGIKNDMALLQSGVFKELWLYGDHISAGMWEEIRMARKQGIPVIAKTPFTVAELTPQITTV